MAEIPWNYKKGYNYVCKERPESTIPVSKAEKKVFKPYGCTTLRMTEMPKANEE